MDMRELGQKIEREILMERIPYVKKVNFDDFNNNEGRMFIELNMEKFRSANGNVRYVFHNVDDTGILGKISNRIRKVVGRHAKIILYESPKKTYTTNYGIKSNDGYNENIIMFDFIRRG